MDGLGRSVGDGISGLVGGAFDAIGAALRGIVDAGEGAVPGGIVFTLFLVIVVIVGWNLVKR